MTAHVIDSELFGTSFAPADLRDLFSDETRVQRWFDVEAALAAAQAELGIVPENAAQEIARKAQVANIDLQSIGAGIAETSHPLVPAIRALAAVCEGEAGQWVHYGATTQDIMDTGAILQVRDAWKILLLDLHTIREALAAHARQHAGTMMVGRTHGQQALPITLGFKLSVWVDEIDRHLERCAEAEKRVFVGNITGAVGTMASFGRQAIDLQRRALRKLDLGVPRICWHSSRDRIVEIASLMVQIAGTAGKIGREIYSLQRTEINEMTEPFHGAKVGSSTMPHKSNPAGAELVFGLAQLVRGTYVSLADALFHEHERDAGRLRIELAALPEIVIYTGACLRRMRSVAEGVRFDTANMRANVDMLGGLLMSERVMLALGNHVGKQRAHELVHEIAMRARESDVSFLQALSADPRVTAHLGAEDIERLLAPEDYLGSAESIVANVVGA
ncbi:MAG: adenylosuccinate lyase [Gammaproteobacteria bacterium]|nr:adenylosuccinate lyase [Gammaproteobacteria bacterium]